MTRLNAKEQQFIKDLLSLMTEESIRALAATVTRRLVKLDNVKTCVSAIILHTSSLDEFLKRQKVTKENLFKYLNERGIPVPNTDKCALELQVKELINGPTMTDGTSSESAVTTIPSPTSELRVLAKPDILDNTPVWTVQEQSHSPVPVIHPLNQEQWPVIQPQGSGQLYLASASTIDNRVTVAQKITTQRITTVTSTTSTTGATIMVELPNTQETAVTYEFAKWFYPRINQSPGVLSEDFWPDAELKLTLRGLNNVSLRTAEGGVNVAQTLNGALEEHQLFLHPNLSTDGVWGRGNENGLLLVLVCGTLHHRTANHCLGVFENLFLLAQDPFAADNWKIKTLEAILRSKAPVTAPLTLGESELAQTFIN